ncbi:hypothetical protein JUN65_14810 [Gluconacetobacter azotocaptans]|uniref:hypothetical protein n=1 Tax=Gluconacetobacter azotocaptans TaxID=142834 RepID=UPI00195B1F70|nr:hypothetical protein [Gluconacetobacter azotocaptans]MBM9402850.1 hypothetical protein [Gluconacetobacter azotocaptans]
MQFGFLVLVSILVVHAIDYLLHEYAHSFMAWILGWKRDPFALNYGTASIDNILFQQQIDENVEYGPIFAGHHGWQAALIAAAGPLFANGGTALICHSLIMRVGTIRAGRSTNRGTVTAASLWWLIWIDAFATFNVWSYAPLRTLTTHADMALLAQGLGISVWLLFPLVTSYAGWLVYRMSYRALPTVQASLYPDDQRLTLSMTVLAVSLGFFSVSGLGGNYGVWSALMDMASLFLLLPALLAGQGHSAEISMQAGRRRL